MSKQLMIVESPAKAKTITKFLGGDYKVMASFGHVRDLPVKKLGVEVEKKFAPTYVVPPKSKPVISALDEELKSASALYLATDLDREGEAIAWHLTQVLHPKIPVKRIVFHEISKSAVEDAISHSRGIDDDLVEAQTARRILDRLVGYTLSPLLWKKIAPRLSAGRVQSAAVRLIVDREREIRAFKSKEYWSVVALLQKPKVEPEFLANLIAAHGKSIGRTDLTEDEAKKYERELEKATYTVSQVEKKEALKSPPPPFTTSTLQQEANRKLGYSSKRTMTIAQHLYEAGQITYMRTDSVQISAAAVKSAREVIRVEFGKEFVPDRPRFFANRAKGVQEAHEAIRPVRFQVQPSNLKGEFDAGHLRLYDLIWKRAIASQMAEAKFERTSVDITAGEFLFRATGQVPLFLGYLKAYVEGQDVAEVVEGALPPLEEKDRLNLQDLQVEQHFTEPPPRYSEATLVKAMEELEIGRPSTYAPTIATIQDRGYVTLEEKKFTPTEIGEMVTGLLEKHFPQIVDYQFTAEMEDQLDDIAKGSRDRVSVLEKFYRPYVKLLHQKEHELNKKELTEEKTDQKCPKCGKELVIKIGRFGRFLACTGYPDCDYTEKVNGQNGKPAPEPKEIGRECPLCHHPLVQRVGKYGPFIGCSQFPECKYIEQVASQQLNVPCPKCHNPLVERRTKKGRRFWGCSTYPKCDFATWDKPGDVPFKTEDKDREVDRSAARKTEENV